MTQPGTADTRALILQAALGCFREYGVRKTTMVDIGRAASVSRSTLYEYFPDKRAVVDAASEHASQLFYRSLARAMTRADSLDDKLGRAAVAVVRARRFVTTEKLSDPTEVQLLLTGNAAALLDECGRFLVPYLVAAKLTGEVRKDLDVDAAAEWLARMLFSLFMTPSKRVDRTDGDAAAEFVRTYAVRGLLDAAPGAARRAR